MTDQTVVDEPRPAESAGEADEVAQPDVVEIPSSWEFIDQPPTTEEVQEKLKTLPPVWGIEQWRYVEFVQPLPQNKNIGTTTQKDYRTVWTLYFTVAGRQKMINDAAEKNGWCLDFEPEPLVPEGNAAGYCSFGIEEGQRIVYREYVKISQWRTGNTQLTTPIQLGRKSGTAWVPATGGSNAVASNRFEKVETSARGRAIAAWGFGVLPGSGVASLEEMRDAREFGQTEQQRQQGRKNGGPQAQRQSPEEVKEEIRNLLSEYQQITGVSDETVDEKVAAAFKRMFDKKPPEGSEESWSLDWLKPGEAVLFRNRMKQETEKLRNEASEI